MTPLPDRFKRSAPIEIIDVNTGIQPEDRYAVRLPRNPG